MLYFDFFPEISHFSTEHEQIKVETNYLVFLALCGEMLEIANWIQLLPHFEFSLFHQTSVMLLQSMIKIFRALNLN